ncbi:hypothetical protein QMA15_25820, partial [Rhodococcus sp. APC 3903]|nr:hypothetical protein [Rhodococcus sp. APC 3903]
MIAIHSLSDFDEAGNPTWTFSVAAGRAAAMFAVLAGVSISFIAERRQRALGADSTRIVASLLTRALLIGLIGLMLGYTDPAYGTVILTYYALMFLLAVPLIYLSTPVLVVIAVVNGIAMPLLSQLVRPRLSGPITDQASFADLFHRPQQLLTTLAFTGEYPALVWMTYICTGLVVGRLALSTARTA